MIYRLAFLLLIVLATTQSKAEKSSSHSTTEAVSLMPFSAQQLTQLNKGQHGKNWLLILWSLDCPPCFKELETISLFHQHNKNAVLVFINTDADDNALKQIGEVIKDYQLTNTAQYYLPQKNAKKLKHRLDPNWYGELPRSYFVDKTGKYQGKSGVLPLELLEQWFE